jgi:hypothetical protein
MTTSSSHNTGGTQHIVTGGTLAAILQYSSKKASAHHVGGFATAADIIAPNVITTGGEILQGMAVFREPPARAFAVLWLFAVFYMCLALCFTLALHRDWTLADSPKSKDDDIHPPFSESSSRDNPRSNTTSSMSTGHRGHHRGLSHGTVSSFLGAPGIGAGSRMTY